MTANVLYVGLEVDDRAFHASVLDPGTGEIKLLICPPKVESLVRKLKKLSREKIQICYEATYVGFSLWRALRKHGFHCDVIAPSLTPRKPGERVKTDRLDSEKLATYYANGLLTVISVPSEEEENVRDLIRSRHFVSTQLKRLRLHLLGLCRRKGWQYRQETKRSYWSQHHEQWLRRKFRTNFDAAIVFHGKSLLKMMDDLKGHVALYDQEIERWSEDPRYHTKVQAVACFRGIRTLSAMTLVTEVGAIGRFAHPRPLMSFVGFDIQEHSSGNKQLQRHITKLGNAHLRRVLVESCQSASKVPQVSAALKRRRSETPLEQTSIADRCMRRLYQRSTHLLARGKPRNKVKVACARELTAFVWEALQRVA